MRLILAGLFLLAVSGHAAPHAHSAARRPHSHAVTLTSSWADVRRRLSAQDAEIALLQRQIARQDAEISQIRRQISPKVAEAAPPTHHTRQLALPAINVYDLVLSAAYPQALDAADDVLSRDPNNAEAQALKGIACAKLGQIDTARASTATALQITDGQQGRPRALALIAAGLLAEANGNKNIAIQTYQNAGNMDLKLALVYVVYADLLHRSNQDNLAKRLLQTGLTQSLTPEETSAIQSTLDKIQQR